MPVQTSTRPECTQSRFVARAEVYLARAGLGKQTNSLRANKLHAQSRRHIRLPIKKIRCYLRPVLFHGIFFYVYYEHCERKKKKKARLHCCTTVKGDCTEPPSCNRQFQRSASKRGRTNVMRANGTRLKIFEHTHSVSVRLQCCHTLAISSLNFMSFGSV